MNQRKPIPCLSQTPAKSPRSSSTLAPSCTSFGYSIDGSGTSSNPVSGGAIAGPVHLGSGANDATRMCRHRNGGRDITRLHVIIPSMTTTRLPSPISRSMLPCMLTVPPFVSLYLGRFERRSLGSLAAVAGRVANGLRVSPAGSCSPARCLAPSCPPLRALAWGLFAALDALRLAAQKSTVVSLL